MRRGILFLLGGVILVGLIAFAQSTDVADTLMALVVFIAISVIAWEPRKNGSPDGQ